MSRTILILVVVAAVAAGAAVLATRNREALTAAGAGSGDAVAPGPLFPVLDERVNDVAEVTVTSSDGSFTVERTGDAWGATDKGGYPVDFGKVRALVVGIAGFDVVEAMTSNPDYHHRLGLEEPGSAPGEAGEPSASKRVTLKDAGGEVLADVVVGQARATQGRGQPSLYARRAGEDQTYEVTGRLTVDTSVTSWLDRKVLELKQERVEEVTITHPDGEVLRISRPSADQASFDVQGLPEGRELVWDGVARSIATAAQNLTLEDVGRDLVDFDQVETTTAEFRTFGGLVITATTAEQDELTYLQVEARVDQAAGPPAPEPEPEASATDDGAPEDGADGATGEQDELDGEPAADDEADPLPTPEELQVEADAINARVGGWTYVVPGWAASNLRKRMDELLKPLEPAGPPPGAPTGEDGAELPMLDTEGEELPPELQQAIQEALKNSESGGVVPPSEQTAPPSETEDASSPPPEDGAADAEPEASPDDAEPEASPDDGEAVTAPDDGARLAG